MDKDFSFDDILNDDSLNNNDMLNDDNFNDDDDDLLDNDDMLNDDVLNDDILNNDEEKQDTSLKKPSYDEIDNYKPTKEDIKKNVSELQGNINSMLDKISAKPEDLFPDKDLLPNLEINVEYHDYDKDIELIKIESKETLECLANLYLTEEQMRAKNIYNIIKDDAKALAKLNFSIEQAQRALISCMKQLDMGVNDPLMYQSVAMFQKEMRDTIKQAYELQRKMKEFYKELKSELNEIEAGDKIKIEQPDNYNIISDPKLLNNILEQYAKDPTLLNMKQNKDNFKDNDDKK